MRPFMMPLLILLSCAPFGATAGEAASGTPRVVEQPCSEPLLLPAGPATVLVDSGITLVVPPFDGVVRPQRCACHPQHGSDAPVTEDAAGLDACRKPFP